MFTKVTEHRYKWCSYYYNNFFFLNLWQWCLQLNNTNGTHCCVCVADDKANMPVSSVCTDPVFVGLICFSVMTQFIVMANIVCRFLSASCRTGRSDPPNGCVLADRLCQQPRSVMQNYWRIVRYDSRSPVTSCLYVCKVPCISWLVWPYLLHGAESVLRG